jgi:hypothetical protein
MPDLVTNPASVQRAGYVTLSFPHVRELQALVSGPERKSSSHLYTAEAGQYACRGGVVVIKKRASWTASAAGGGGGAARDSETLELRSDQNHLVVKWQDNGFMMIGFVLPITYRQSEWYRFERYRGQP